MQRQPTDIHFLDGQFSCRSRMLLFPIRAGSSPVDVKRTTRTSLTTLGGFHMTQPLLRPHSLLPESISVCLYACVCARAPAPPLSLKSYFPLGYEVLKIYERHSGLLPHPARVSLSSGVRAQPHISRDNRCHVYAWMLMRRHTHTHTAGPSLPAQRQDYFLPLSRSVKNLRGRQASRYVSRPPQFLSAAEAARGELTVNGELPQTGTPSKRENRVQFTHAAC